MRTKDKQIRAGMSRSPCLTHHSDDVRKDWRRSGGQREVARVPSSGAKKPTGWKKKDLQRRPPLKPK